MRYLKLPKEWKWKNLKDITECLDNKRIPLNSKQREKRKGEIPYYGANGKLDSINDFIFNEELLLLAEDGGSWGPKEECAYIINGKSWVNNHAHVLRMKSVVLMKFLRAWLNLKDLRKYISGSTRGKLNRKSMEKIEVPLPPIRIQKQIVMILEKVGKLKVRRQIAGEETEKIIQDIFYKNFLSRKEKYKEKDLGNVAKFINGRAFKPSEWEKVGKPIIRIQNLTGTINRPNRTTKKFEKKYLVKKGDILISWSATLGAFIWNNEEGWLNQHIFKVNEDKKLINKLYLFQFVRYSIDKFKKQTHGSTMKHITKKDFDKIKIPLPPIELQNKFSEQVKKIEKIKQYQRKSEQNINTLFDTLMQKAFKGELVI